MHLKGRRRLLVHVETLAVSVWREKDAILDCGIYGLREA